MITLDVVRNVLFDAWDPLDVKYLVTIRDEYDDIAPRILALLVAGEGSTAIASTLD